MYYLDLYSNKEEKAFHLTEVFNKLHYNVFGKYSDTPYCVAIPTSKKRRFDKFVLEFYGIIRIFANEIKDLEIIKFQNFNDILYSDITEVDFDSVTSWVYYKQYKISKNPKFKDRHQKYANENFPFLPIVTSKYNRFSLYFEKILANEHSQILTRTNSYGVSRKENMVAIPEIYL